jgi:hypothetical protein
VSFIITDPSAWLQAGALAAACATLDYWLAREKTEDAAGVAARARAWLAARRTQRAALPAALCVHLAGEFVLPTATALCRSRDFTPCCGPILQIRVWVQAVH